jgi:hypothetical protein
MLPSPREVRHALVYVLNNFRKHERGARGIDPCSSARWFAGWTTPLDGALGSPPVAAPRTWLARIGWMRHGRIRIDETPRGRRHGRPSIGAHR